MKSLLLTLSATLLMTSTSQAQTAGIKDSPEYQAIAETIMIIRDGVMSYELGRELC